MRYRISFLLSTIFMAILCQPSVALAAGKTKIPEYMPPLKLEEGPVQNHSDKLMSDIREIASSLCGNLQYPGPPSGTLLVTTFVELDNLYSTSSLGRYLAEQLMNEFQQRKFNVLDIRKSDSILVRKHGGEFGISREFSEIKKEISAKWLLSGTYLVGPDDVLVNARILDNKTGKVLTGASKRIHRTPVVEKMLYAGPSVEVKKEGVMYMKELGR